MTTRREFMVGAAGLTFTVLMDGCAALRTEERGGAALAPAPAGGSVKVNAWASLSTDGTIYIANPAVEMGQGSQTAIPLIIAEEMDADWSRVRIVPAAPDDKIYGNPGFRGLMYTAGSATVTGYWDVARTFGAQVRRVMMENAARKWDAPLAELSTEPSAVVHAKTGRRLSYGEIAAFAQLPATAPAIRPDELKKPEQYRLIGKDVMRVELPTKVNGTAQYSIDVQLPGMLYGAVLRGPVEGTSPAAIDDAQARAVPGVMRVVRMPFGVGVIAETPWAAFDAKNALKVTWDRSARAFGHDSDKAVPVYSAAARNLSRAGKPWDTAGDAPGAMQKTAKVVESEFVCDYSYHAQMEPLHLRVVAVIADHGGRGGRQGARHPGRQGEAASDPARRRLRPARTSRRGICRRLGAALQGSEAPGENDVDARGRRAQRALPPAVGTFPARRAGLVEPHRRLAAPRRLRRDHRVPGPGALQ